MYIFIYKKIWRNITYSVNLSLIKLEHLFVKNYYSLLQ